MTKQELISLRQQIVLGSLYTDDYNNSFNIPATQVQDFFDAYLENCTTLPNDKGVSLGDLNLPHTQYYDELFKLANDNDLLWEYYNTYDEDPLSKKYFEKYYKNQG